MIRSIKLENFKSIQESCEIEMAPITLLMGPNSSGKSSIIKPLLLMKQTADSRDIQRSVQFDGAYVSLGAFHDFVFNHDNSSQVKFTINFEPARPLIWRARTTKRTTSGRVFWKMVREEIKPENVTVIVSLGIGTQEQIITKKTTYRFGDGNTGLFEIEKVRGERGVYSGKVSYKDEEMAYAPLKKSKFYDMSQSPRLVEYQPLRRSELGYNLPRLLNYITRQFELMILNIIYLGPLREAPAPLYGGVSERPQDVGTAGEDAATVLWVGRGERKQKELKRKVEKWMDTFEISKRINLKKLGPFFQVYLTDWYTGIKSNWTDIGFGASQLLPVIIAGYYAQEKSLIIAEQPEIHLHPKAQAKLGDLFIDVSKENKKLVVETHSEHLLGRIQRRIAEGKIDTNDVALYYCEPSRKGTIVKRIMIDEYGQLEPKLPAGFFEESYIESKAHLEAIVSKRRIESSSMRRSNEAMGR